MARTLIRAQTQIENASDNANEDGYFLRSDGSVPLAGDLDAGGTGGPYKIINLATPTNGGDAATKSYVDGIAQGLDIKDSVRAATESSLGTWTASGTGVGKTLTSPDNNTSNNTFDGVTLVVGDRLLVKNGGPNATTNVDNGIYEVTQEADGSTVPTILTRTEDFDEDSEVTAGAFTFVAEGTANADTGWVLTSDDPLTVDTDALAWSQFSGAGSIIAGAGLTKTGNTIDVVAADNSITVNTDDIQVAFDSTASTIELGDDGIRVANTTAGDILIGQGPGTETAFQTISGDATLAADGTLTLDSTVVFESDYIVREEITHGGGAGPHTLANTPVTGSEMIFLNGQLLQEGASNDYTISGADVTFTFTPKSAPGNPDVILVTYLTS